jgi:hypothetical protein
MRYRANCVLCWDFDSTLSPERAAELTKQQIESLYPQLGLPDLRLLVRLDKLKEKIQKVRLGEFQMSDIIPYITKDDSKREYESDGVKYAVKMNSQRYFLFRECTKCIACGLQGTRILLEHHPADKSPHFNLYAEEDGKLILMTKDHIHAKSCGGEDRHSNYQTMCIICNNLKGHANLTIDSIRELRLIYNENKAKVTKKKLHLLIEEAKARMARPWDEAKLKASQRIRRMKASAEAVVTNCDLSVWRVGGDLVAKSVYEPITQGFKQLACIRKGTFLEPMLVMGGRVVCKFSDQELVSVPQQLVRQKDS